jgi:hypothetical protein
LAALTNLIWENCFLCVSASHLPRNALTLRSSGLIIIQSGLEGRSIIDTIQVTLIITTKLLLNKIQSDLVSLPIPDERRFDSTRGAKHRSMQGAASTAPDAAQAGDHHVGPYTNHHQQQRTLGYGPPCRSTRPQPTADSRQPQQPHEHSTASSTARSEHRKKAWQCCRRS